MAEVAGLALGVVALIGTFKDCIELFSYITAAQSLGRDYEILDTKLDIEKTLFLQWAERVRLVNPPYDKRLNDPTIQKTVARVLASVRFLLSESKDLQNRYGLQQVADDSMMIDVEPTISGPRMTRFIREFEALNVRLHDERKDISKLRKVRWAIQDKQKFDDLIRKLSYFIFKLNFLIPTTGESMMFMAEQDLKGLESLRDTRLVLEAASGHEKIVAELAERAIVESCERRILQSIWYRKMDDRRDDITQPHFKTLEWALNPPDSVVEWDDLSEWLQSGSGIYWLCGKAGSGKSTLMKYLYNHPETKSLLLTWSGVAALTSASFFFWNLGAEEQKSQAGLMRALLFHVLNADPSLISELLPRMWREANDSNEEKLSPPSLAEMTQGFEKLSKTLNSLRKICFFIDGLDEFSGNYFDGISFIKRLSADPNIKIIVSSRPIPACVDAFSIYPKLQLQYLTREDIVTYVYDTVGSHSYITDILDGDPEEASSILTDLIEKASGVFLWVVLACRSLLAGFAAFDRITDLRNRIDELPPELEDLFQHMLDKIEPRYKGQAAKLLRVCYQNYLVPPRGVRTKDIKSISLAFIDDHDMDLNRIPPIRNMIEVDQKKKCRLLEGRLRSRCCGLLEIKRADLNRGHACFCGSTSPDSLADCTVAFLHRSVFEFLDSPNIWSLDCLQFRDKAFEPNAMLSCLSLYSALLSSRKNENKVLGYVKNMLLYAANSQHFSSTSIAYILFKFEEAVPILHEMYHGVYFGNIMGYIHSLKGSKSHLIALLAVEMGMVSLVQSYERANSLKLSELVQDYPPLQHAINQPLSNFLPVQATVSTLQARQTELSTAMIKYLLSSGCDPNENIVDPLYDRESTPWTQWFQSCYAKISYDDPPSTLVAAKITELFIRANADLGAIERTTGEAVETGIENLFVNYAPGSWNSDTELVRKRGRDLLGLIQARREGRFSITGASITKIREEQLDNRLTIG